MTQLPSRPDDETINRAAKLIAQALTELQLYAAGRSADTKAELAAGRDALEQLAGRLERELVEDKEQRLLLAGQLSNLAGSLDRLVGHLQGLSQLLADLLQRLAEQPAPPPPAPIEPAFQPGGEGLSLALVAVPGFQALMDIQKALIAMDEVASASVERFQEGDSRLLIQLRTAVTAAGLASALHRATSHHFAVEEARPELSRLRLKLVPGA